MKNLNENEVVKYNTDGGLVELDFNIIRNVIAVGNNITDSEVIQFMQLCKYRKLNPFLKQVHLVKFKDKAEIIVGIDTFTQRLNAQPTCLGWETGVICINEKNEVIERVGTFHLPSEKLIAAYCTIEREGWKKPFKWTVNLSDYYRTFYNKATGRKEPMGQWATMPAVMLTKCAIVSCVRKVYSEEFGGMYSGEELGVENSNIIEAEFKELKDEKKYEEMKQKELFDNSIIDVDVIDCLIESAKSDNVEYDEMKLIEFVLNGLYSNKEINSNEINKLQNKYFDVVSKKISEAKLKKEQQEFAKLAKEAKEIKEIKETTSVKNESIENTIESENDLPVPGVDEGIAKPANNKKSKSQEKKENKK